jgi:hypothetical protein
MREQGSGIGDQGSVVGSGWRGSCFPRSQRRDLGHPATVSLPDYFEALNRDFRYQLTVIGQFAQAIVAQKVAGNRFVIRTSKPGVEVSWQVTGIRQDAYANAERIPVEEAKPANEQGYYLHPEVFGQPASKSVAAAGQPPSSSNAIQVNSR